MEDLSSIELPNAANGIIEVGISAGADEIDPNKWGIKVGYVKTRETDPAKRRLHTIMAKIWAIRDAFDKDVSDGKTTIDSAVFTPEVFAHMGVADQSDILGGTCVADFYDGPFVPDAVPCWATTIAINNPPVMEPECMRFWECGIAFLIAAGWMVGDNYEKSAYVTHLTVAETVAARADARYDKAGVEAASKLWPKFQEVATLLAAMKVTWWLTNHHVGQRLENDGTEMPSYIGKVWKTTSISGSMKVSDARDVLHALGKYCSTIWLLAELGVPNLTPTGGRHHKDHPLKPFTIKASVDVGLRIGAFPAGTARLTTYYAILQVAERSVFSVLLPPVDVYDQMKEEVERIKINPARYHEGSKFMTGLDQIKIPELEVEDAENIAGFIYATAPSGTLARAKVLPGKDAVSGNLVYQSITAVKAQIIGVATDAAALEMIAMLRGGLGSNKGGFARQINRITDEQVTVAEEKANAKVEKEKEKEKAK